MFSYQTMIRLLLLISLLPTNALADPEPMINYVYYMVAGTTADDIWADIIEKSPVRQNSKRHVAYTRWNVHWQFWWFDSGNSCEINKLTTKLDVTYTLPRLKQSPEIAQAVTAHWDKYYAALFDHEQGHKDLGVQAAIEIENRIMNMGPRQSCEQLELDANEIGKNIINKFSRLEKEYDSTTNHGLNTGAVFP